MATASSPIPSSMLEVVENLARSHREHERYYAEAPLHDAIMLQRTSRALKALAERWRESEPLEHPLPVPFAGATDLNDDRAIETLGILFMENGCAPAEIEHLKTELRAFAQGSSSIGRWLAATMDAGWEMAKALLEFSELADLLAERHRIITTDWRTATLATVIGHTVDRAVDILDRIDFTPEAIRKDLAGQRVDSRLLFSACELLDHAADLAAHSSTLTHENDRRWRVFHDRVRSLVEQSPNASNGTDPAPGGNGARPCRH
jgi:hypothetical protein